MNRRSQPQVPWTILKRFGYGDNLNLEIPAVLKEMSTDDIHAEKGTAVPELSYEAIRFLSGIIDCGVRQLGIDSLDSSLSQSSLSSSSISGDVVQMALSVLSPSVHRTKPVLMITTYYFVYVIFNFGIGIIFLAATKYGRGRPAALFHTKHS